MSDGQRTQRQMTGADETTDVIIVGAGGGGAVLGLTLAQRGIPSIVLERADGPPSGLRGEILQPNGQRILDQLGVLGALATNSVREVHRFHFHRAGGERLCTINYGELPPPYNRALVTLPNVAHHGIVRALQQANPQGLRYGTTVTELLRSEAAPHGVEGVVAETEGRRYRLRAKLVVGADGAFSKVREALGIPADLHLYPQGYLIAIVPNVSDMTDARYFVGHRQILGLFPAAEGQAYVFYMIKAGTYDQVKAAGIDALKAQWRAIDPQIGPIADRLESWTQTGYMPTGRVRTPRWATDGAVLIGDAAHAMNPHASQGRMQAMADAMALAEIIETCRAQDRWDTEALSAFERLRRPQVDMLQRLADEQVLFWNTGNPLVAYLRDRVFRTLDRNARLRYRMLMTTAGWRATRPFGYLDRLMAAGLVPDVRAEHIEKEWAT
ncbi:MAG: NAD(P)/FAD-dependent oxidoreductase [Nitrospiraceae bacterium]